MRCARPVLHRTGMFSNQTGMRSSVTGAIDVCACECGQTLNHGLWDGRRMPMDELWEKFNAASA